SYIPTTNVDITRSAESLYVPMAFAPNLMPGGFSRIELRFAPNYASGEQATDHDLIVFNDTDDHLFVRKADNAIVLSAGGNGLASTRLQWSREQPLDVIAVNTATEFSLTVTVGMGTPQTQTLPQGKPLPTNADLYILGSTKGAQECADL